MALRSSTVPLELNPLLLVGLPLLLGVAAYYDLRWRRVPNALTLTVALGGLVFRWADAGSSAVWGGIGLGCIVFSAGFLMQLCRLLGGGDVKLFAAASVWLGRSTIWTAVAGTAIAGGILGLVYLRSSGLPGGPPGVRKRDETLLERVQLPEGDDSTHVPYAVAIGIGCSWAWTVQLGFLSGV